MAVVWSGYIYTGFFFTNSTLGYRSAGTGFISDTTANMLGGATVVEFSYSSAGFIFKVSGNRSGGWATLRVGDSYLYYSDMTRTYDGVNTTWSMTAAQLAEKPGSRGMGNVGSRVYFAFHDVSLVLEPQIEVYSSGGSYKVFTSARRYPNILAAGRTNISPGSNVSITATGVGQYGSIMLTDMDINYADQLTVQSYTDSFRIYNASGYTLNVGYIAIRT